ncbi:peptidoglycan-binding domain-containing protein [Roseovarius ramblicola]|uniref:Peptidoglycan-binding domain-containing protein n=1 Tax=Roseovarius ramblicola TaxID=2022336 RepID=A0ABV5I2E6_9RHOB
MPRRSSPAAALILALAACQPVSQVPGGPPPGLAEAPPGAPPGTCWGRQVSPAVVETVTEQVQTAPAVTAPDGRVIAPARYATETRQAIVEERRVRWIETPCPAVQTPDFIASLQRALIARALHTGPVTGRTDKRTRAAIRRYQAARGLDSDILSLKSARELGLVALPRPE